MKDFKASLHSFVQLPSHAPRSLASARAEATEALGEVKVPTFDELYRQSFHDVCRWARALGGLDADVEDIAQEVFLVVRRKLDGFEGERLHAWLYGITRKTVSDHRRRAWARRVLRAFDAFESTPENRPLPDELAENRQAMRVLSRLLERMSSVRRTAFVLYEIEGYSGEEIAELEGIPVKTVYTRLHHARKDFMGYLEQLEQQEGGKP